MLIDDFYDHPSQWLLIGAAVLAFLQLVWLLMRPKRVVGIASVAIIALLGALAYYLNVEERDYMRRASFDPAESQAAARDRLLADRDRSIADRDRRIERLIQEARRTQDDAGSASEQLDRLLRIQGDRLDELSSLAFYADPSKAGSSAPRGPRDYTESANQERYRGVAAQIDALGRILSRLEQDASRPADTISGDLERLRDRMANGRATQAYEVVPLLDDQLVSGQVGKYYVIDLKDVDTGIKFQFEGGRYTLQSSNRAFRWALNIFVADVIRKLEGDVRYTLFVRGSADRLAYRGRFQRGFEFEEVRYLQASGDGRYGVGERSRRISGRFHNEDLPFLRAEFLKQVVVDTYRLREPVVLEGVVTERVDTADRNAELILYVDW